MGQQDILTFLREKYNEDPTRWYSTTEVKEALFDKGLSDSVLRRTHFCLMQLSTYKLIKFKGLGMWKHKKLFQYKNDK